MKKRLQGFIVGLILGVVLFTGTAATAANYQALAATFPVYINGAEWQTDSPPIVIDGHTYLPLKALGDVLGVDIQWNSALFRVDITKPEEIVVISDQGNKYHRQNCPTVKKVKEYVTKEEAAAMGYEPCGVCQP
ncbi:MAG: copper amine oxidase N-terminal domain-containing protein [Oscillospiraceae bacterium]|nr:copper amine oxidase N-terminal domain-containing protein [Oscillospiraceae bacterium]